MPWDIKYGTGAVNGSIVTDNLSIAGLKLDRHKFGVATGESPDFSGPTAPFDGLMGLARSVCPRSSASRTLPNIV